MLCDGPSCDPTGQFAGVGRVECGVAAAMQPGGREAILTIADVDRLGADVAHWPDVQRVPSARLSLVRAGDRWRRKRGVAALLLLREGTRARTIGLDAFELCLIESITTRIRLDKALDVARRSAPSAPIAALTALRRLAGAGALLACWPRRPATSRGDDRDRPIEPGAASGLPDRSGAARDQ